MDNLEQLEVVQLDGFTPSIPVEPGREQELASRFNMLFLQPGSTLHGGFGAVAKVVNLYEEVFALKRLNAPDSNSDCSPSELREMLFEEYKNQLAVSRLKGFPQVYGYGSWKGEPLILMEWIEGTTLAHAVPDLPHEGDGVQGEVVAQVGISVLEILQGVERLNSRLVHRDISPNNIMFRTKDMSLSQQIAAGAFDTCLIDFGNSTTECQDIPMAFTQRVGMMRGATRDYAPPEMLTADVEGVEELRNNPAIDIYALCSVLYELYAGHTPFDLTHSLGGSDYRTKMSMDPKPLVARRTYEAPLLNAIMSGIRPSQEARPTVDGLLYELECWYEGRQRNGTVAAPKPVEMPEKYDADSGWDETTPVGNAVVVPLTESNPFENDFVAPVAESATVPMPHAEERFEASRKTPVSAPEPTGDAWSEPDVFLMLPVRSTFRFPRRCPCLRLAPHGVRQAPRRRGLALHRRRGPALHPPQPLLVLLRARQPPGPPRGLHRRDRKEVEDQALLAPRNPVLPLLLRAPCRRPLRLPYRLLRRRLLHRRPLFPRAFRVREKRNEGPFRAVAHLLGLGTFVIRVPCEYSVGDC